MVKLSERKKEILREVIARFVESAEPVSSQNIVENSSIALSSATIRKEMAELEDMGLLTHPHTSAGRIPSDSGYRFFVDNFIKGAAGLKKFEEKNLPQIKFDTEKDMEIETILQKSSEQLSKITSYLSMVMAPAMHHSRFRHIEILKLNSSNLLIVLITDSGRVYKRNLIIESIYNSIDFQSVSNLMNQQLRDMSISDIEFKNLKVTESNAYLIPLIKKILDVIRNCFQDTMVYNRIFISGTSSVINHPDFIDLKKIQKILSIIENEYLLMNIMLDFQDEPDQEVIIKIGSEIFEEGTDDLSLVASKYRIYEHSTGTIGILGPKRMDYFKVINIISSFVKNLKTVLS
jgi:heat-inducible transcriptional repressor